ncbi:MAG TPA: DUF21 domain-containing protein [Kiritimatiellae bacterium]|nr:DUF21 domain-containing protein [Kiritimatiellia bacterium]
MTMPIFQIAVVIAAVSLAAFYAGIETGVISLRRVRLEHFVRRGDRRARLADHFLRNPDRLFGTTLVGTNLCTVIASVGAASLAAGVAGGWGAGAAGILMTLVMLIFGEYLPKAWFRAAPTERSLRLIVLLKFSEKLLYPLGMILTELVKALAPLPAHRAAFQRPFVTREELRLLALESEAAGRLGRREREIITAILELPDRRAEQVMTPAAEMVWVPLEADGSQAVEAARRSGRTRLVVLDRRQGRVAGTVNVLDVLRLQGESSPLAEFLLPACFVSREAPLTEVLKQMRMLREPLLLVGDAGECAGLITTEDVLGVVIGRV